MRLSLLVTLFVVILCSCDKTPKEKTPESNNRQLAWIKTYGGSEYDFANAIAQGADSGYVLAGASRSSDRDVPGSRIGYDVWIAKVDTGGNKIWSKTYGGQNDEYATSIVKTPDGGYIISGYTFLANQNHAGWLIKANANGDQQWQKNFNQTADGKALGVINGTDGGYVVVGYLNAGAGGYQAWAAKLDAAGNQQWSKTFGGSEADYASAIVAVPAGGYALCGYTRSTDGDLSGGNGNEDGWILRLDNSGNKMWSKSYGGSNADQLTTIISTPDGGLAAGGFTRSNNGDISGNKGGIDEWLLKLDGSGSKQWSKTFGGTSDDYATSLITTTSGGYALLGYTNSTNGDVSRSSGDFGGWLIKLDASGGKQFQSTYGWENDDFTNGIIQTNDGGYMIAGYTNIQNRDFDAWLVKIASL